MSAKRLDRRAKREARVAERRANRRRSYRVPVPLVAAAVGVATIAFVAVSWYGAQSKSPSGAQVAQTAPSSNIDPRGFSAPLTPPEPGAPAPDFTVSTLDHGPFALAAQRGKPVVVFFTASYCEPCKPQMRALARIQQEVGADKLGVLVLDVDPTETPADLRRLVRDLGSPPYPFALDAVNRVTLAYGVRALDTKMFIDRSGVLADRVDGIPETDQQLRHRVVTLLESG